MSRSRNLSRHDLLNDAWDEYHERNDRKLRGKDRRRERKAKHIMWDEA